MKNDKKIEKINDALGRLPLDLIEESAGYNPAAVRAGRIRTALIAIAAVFLIAAIPLAVFFSRGGGGVTPADSSEESATDVLEATNTVSPGSTNVLETDTLSPGPGDESTAAEQTVTDVPTAPEFIENPTAPSSGTGITALSYTVPAELASISISAEGTDSGIVPVDASFIVRTASATTAATLASNLSVTPATALSLTRLSDTEYRITPAEGVLSPGKVYRFTLGDPKNPTASFAFQTAGELVISSILPADSTIGIPVNTGIEVTFSEAVAVEEVRSAFSILPEVSGSFLLYPDGKTVAFVPDDYLNYNTEYTVKVGEGIKALSGKTLAAGRTSRFITASPEDEIIINKTGSDETYFFWTQVKNYSWDRDGCFSPGDDVVITYSLNGMGSSVSPSLESFETGCDLYAFHSAADAAGFWLEVEKSAYMSDPSESFTGFDLIGYFEGTENNYFNYSIDLGGSLPKGIYLAKIRSKAVLTNGRVVVDYCFRTFQITDLRTYTFACGGDACVWLCRTDGTPVPGAAVNAFPFNFSEFIPLDEVSDAVSSETGSDGLAKLDTGDFTHAVITVESGDDAVVIIPLLKQSGDSARYLCSLYTDRETYFSTDTVNFSGFVVEESGGEIPEYLLLTTAYSSVETKVDVDENGFFRGSLSIDNFAYGSLFLRLSDKNGTLIIGKMISFTGDSKPKITASITFDRPYYSMGDTVNATLKASFFDGTPVGGLEFSYSSNHTGVSGSATTDEYGEIKISFRIDGTKTEVNSTDAVTLTVDAELTGTELQKLTATASVPLFHSKYVLKRETTDEGIVFLLNERDLSAIDSFNGVPTGNFDSLTTGEPVKESGQFLYYDLVRKTVVREKVTNYNPNTKKTSVTWKYSTKTATVKQNQKVAFIDGKAVLPLKESDDPYVSYEYVVTFTDYSSYYYYNSSLGIKRVNKYAYTCNCTLRPEGYFETRYGRNGQNETGNFTPEIILNSDVFNIGDTVTARAYFGGVAANALFYAAGAGINGTALSSFISFEFTEDCIGGTVGAVIYNTETGRFESTSKKLKFDKQSNILNPVITADKSQYRPGDVATVEISVPGLGEGTVVVSIVDEACFAIKEQTVDPLDFWVPYSIDYRYSERLVENRRIKTVYGRNYYLHYGYIDSIPKGGGGGDSPDPYTGDWQGYGSLEGIRVRKYFADNPVYSVIKTDAEGKGILIFTVPDNITSWRITAIALDLDGRTPAKIRTGVAVSDTICTLPFFVDLDCCSEYVEGDSVAAGLRSYGTEAEGDVCYRAYLVGEGGSDPVMLEVTADCREKAWIRFDGVEEGRYKLTVYAVCGQYRDACEYELTVIKSASSANICRTVTAEELKNLSPAYYPVTLTVSATSDEYRLYERIVKSILYSANSERTDEYAALIAALTASDMLYGTDSQERCKLISNEIFKRYNYGYGQFKLLSYSEGDPALTASLVNLGLVTDFNLINRIIDNSRATVSSRVVESPEILCQSVSILAYLGDPVLDTLFSIASGADGYSDEAKLWLALAFSSAGDYESARSLYSAVRSASATENVEYGTLGFGAGLDISERVRLTSLALTVSTKIERNDSSKLARWLVENGTLFESPVLGLSAYLKFFNPAEFSEETSFEYRIGDRYEKITLSPGESFTFTLSRGDFERLELVLPENAEIRVNYRGSLEEAGEKESDRFGLNKTFETRDDGFCRVTLTLTGKSSRLSEVYELYDLIPSGARFVSLTDTGSSVIFRNTSGQNVRGILRVSAPSDCILEGQECLEYEFSVSVSYIIRAALEGDFTVESAWARNLSTGEVALSGRSRISVGGEGEWTFAE